MNPEVFCVLCAVTRPSYLVPNRRLLRSSVNVFWGVVCCLCLLVLVWVFIVVCLCLKVVKLFYFFVGFFGVVDVFYKFFERAFVGFF